MILERASLIINKFHDLLNALAQRVDLNNDKRAYSVIFEIFHQAVHGKPLLLRDLRKDVRLLSTLNLAKEFLDFVSETVNNYSASLSALTREVFRKAFMELDKLPRNLPRYVIVCDGFSVIDATYIALAIKREGIKSFVAPLINSGGVTETYKFLLEPHVYLQGADLTLEDVARRIAEKIDAKVSVVFGDYDKTIHQLKDVEIGKIMDTMYKLTLRLYGEIIRLRNSIVIVLSDHSYDIVERGAGLYETKHSWSPRSLSVVAPLLIIE